MSQTTPRRSSEEERDPGFFSPMRGLRREIEGLSRQRWFILCCALTFTLVAAAYNYGSRPIYEAVAVLSMDEAGVSPLRARGSVDQSRRAVALEYQVRLLESPEIALVAVSQAGPRVVAELSRGPLGDWKQRIVDEARFRLGFPRQYGASLPDRVQAFRSRLSVEYEFPSVWITARFRAYDPEAATLAAQGLLAIYLAETEQRTQGEAGATREGIESKVAATQGQVAKSVGKLKEFERKEGLEGAEARRGQLTSELARLQESLLTARQNRLARQALLDETERLSSEQMLTIPAIRDDREVTETRSRIADLQATIARKAVTLGDRHPEILALRADLGLAQRSLVARTNLLRESTTRDYRLAAREEEDLSRMIEGARKQLAQLDVNAVERSFLQKEAEAGQHAVGELIDRRVREADAEVFFAPRVIQIPETSSTPVSPQRTRNFQYALGIGLLVGFLLAWLRSTMDETLKTPEDVKAAFGVTLLGMVPGIPGGKFDLLVPETAASTQLFEAFRVLRTNLMAAPGRPEAHPLILVSSSRAGEGKTTTACGLAVTMARAGLRVLLVDGDMRRSSLSALFSATNRLGLSDLLMGRPAEKCISETRVPGLQILPSGTSRPNPAELLTRPVVKDVFNAIRLDYDWVVCDAPPVLAVADAAILARLADSVLVVIGANSTPAPSVHAVLEELSTVGARVGGLLLNRVDLRRDAHYYRYYYASQFEDYSAGSRRAAANSTRSKVRR